MQVSARRNYISSATMRISVIISVILGAIGTLLLILALLAGLVSIEALVSRIQYGPGLMFADVEFFGLVAFVCAGFGVLLVIVAKKLKK